MKKSRFRRCCTVFPSTYFYCKKLDWTTIAPNWCSRKVILRDFLLVLFFHIFLARAGQFEVENSTMSGLKQVIVIKEGKTNLSPRSLSNFQSAVRCNSPECSIFLYFDNLAPALTSLMELLLWILIHFLEDKKDYRATTTTLQTESRRNVKWLCSRVTLHAPRTWAIV